jgi:hypothetical protein
MNDLGRLVQHCLSELDARRQSIVFLKGKRVGFVKHAQYGNARHKASWLLLGFGAGS